MTIIFYELITHLNDLEDKIARNIEESEILQREVEDIRRQLLEAEVKLKKKEK